MNRGHSYFYALFIESLMVSVNKNVKLKNKYSYLPPAGKSAFWFTLCNYMLKGISLIMIPIFTRLLIPEEYGILSEITAVEEIVLILSNWDVSVGAYLKGLYKYDDIDFFTSVTQFFANIVTVLLYIAIFFVGIIFGNRFGFSNTAYFVMFLNHLFFPSYRLWLIRRQSKFDYKPAATATLIYGTAISCVPLITVLLIGRRAEVKFDTTMLVSAIFCLPFFLKTINYSGILRQKDKLLGQLKYIISYQAPFLVSSLSYVMLTQLDRVIIGQMVGHQETAFYGVACSIISGLTILFNSIGNAMLPWKYGKLKGGEFLSIRKIESCILVGLFLVTLVFISLAPEVMCILFPSSYFEATMCIPALAVGSFYNYVSSLFASVETYYEKTKYIAFGMVFSSGLNILLNCLLIGHFGYIACAYTTAVSYMFYVLLHSIFSRATMKQMKLEAGLFNQILIFVICVAAIPASAIMMVLFPYPVVRYVLTGGVLVAVIWKRKWIMEMMGSIHTSKSLEK